MKFVFLVFALVGFLATTPAGRAEDLSAIRQRMAERLPKLDSLKQQGALGEDNRGFVEVRGGGAADADATAAAENGDRQAVYQAIAAQTGASADAVGRARARQIATDSKPGVWLQAPDGHWYRK